MATNLDKKQREKLLAWIGEGLETDEINKRAAKFKPPFQVKRSLVQHYRKTRQIDLEKIKHSGEINALTTGLALKDERVKRLNELAEKLWIDVNGARLWTKETKIIGYGKYAETIEVEMFNSAEVREFRGLLDDISKELGHRRAVVEVNSWEPRILAAIRAGEVVWAAIVEEFGPSLAAELYKKAGVDSPV